ncbi:MAG: Smr/MutS family protein [Bacteroidales bacterium]|jgi:DNA mismatch repair protein MutS2|nr:Smr/MutS family protein [Bacteroidales bacterium]
MIYPDNFEEKIGFTTIRKLLKEQCISSMGIELCNAMHYLADCEAIDRLLQETDEFRSILLFDDPFPAQDFHDLKSVLSHIRVDGAFIEIEELALLRSFINAIIQVFVYLKVKHEEGKYLHLWRHCEQVMLEKELLEAINRILDPKGNLKDNASDELSRIRHAIIRISNEADKKIRKLLHSVKQDGLVKEDAEMTIRNGRLCIPVPAQFKRKVPGFVHDESATGQTVFIEPTAVFDANNELKDLMNAEKREIIRILTVISEQIRPAIPNILAGHDFLGMLDFIRAKAKLGIMINAVKPHLFNEAKIEWTKAVHPLLYLNLKNSGKKIEPLDIGINKESRILIISGPNAGGKSVCLKTVGLLQYMLQCGLLPSLHESSEMGIFAHFFIDMGDEQSIDNELSTYSSHLTNLKIMVENLEPHSLFLIDEFGSGTEPALGGAMAEAVLKNMYQSGAFGIITTHYGNLKLFSDTHPQAINGAMLFDTHALKPLFKLKLGKPGSSFTYEIARKIGLSETIIADAIEKSGSAQIDYERKLEEIEITRLETEQQLKMANAVDEQLAQLIDAYARKYEELDKQRKEILQNAKNQANHIIDNANKLIEKTIREIRENQASSEKIKAARQEISTCKKELDREIIPIEQEADMKSLLPAKREATVMPPVPAADNSPVVVGDNVLLIDIQTIGEVMQVSGNDITVSFNSITLRTALKNVEKISKRSARNIKRGGSLFNDSSIADMLNQKIARFQVTLDLRGQRADEALQALETYLDEAQLLNIRQVKILHGTGTGVLRQVIRQFLSRQKKIISFHDEALERGGHGITVINL